MGESIVRFFRGELLLGVAEIEPDKALLQIAEMIGIEIPRNCTSGNCGTCMARLISGVVKLPDVLPPGIDEDLIEDGATLTCIGIPDGNCDIDLIPPL
jgi:ferredoxin